MIYTYSDDDGRFIVTFDTATGYLHGKYGEVVNGEIAALVYMRGIGLVKPHGGIPAVKGCIFDFRQVERFERDNLAQVQRESYRLNSKVSLDHVPVALLVETKVQEQTIRISQQITPEQHRKRIVKSVTEAHNFFKEWHEKYANA